MAKRKRPDPAITERWTEILRGLAQKLARRRRLVDETEEELGEAIRGAFAEGVLVGPIKEATGLSGSRAYQIKFALRDQEQASHDTAS
jgi:hypothetical protein